MFWRDSNGFLDNLLFNILYNLRYYDVKMMIKNALNEMQICLKFSLNYQRNV